MLILFNYTLPGTKTKSKLYFICIIKYAFKTIKRSKNKKHLSNYSTKVVIYIAIQNKTQNANLKFYEMIRVDLYSTTRI